MSEFSKNSFYFIFAKACFNGHYNVVKFLLESDANVNLTDSYGQNALHYATTSNNERICKLLCHSGVETSEATKIANLQPKDYAVRAIPASSNTKSEFVEKEYLSWTKAMRKYEKDPNFITDRDKPRNSEERIYDLIWRYDNMVLSEIESDGADEVKGEVYKKPKKKKTGKKGKKGAKKKGGKKKKK